MKRCDAAVNDTCSMFPTSALDLYMAGATAWCFAQYIVWFELSSLAGAAFFAQPVAQRDERAKRAVVSLRVMESSLSGECTRQYVPLDATSGYMRWTSHGRECSQDNGTGAKATARESQKPQSRGNMRLCATQAKGMGEVLRRSG